MGFCLFFCVFVLFCFVCLFFEGLVGNLRCVGGGGGLRGWCQWRGKGGGRGGGNFARKCISTTPTGATIYIWPRAAITHTPALVGGMCYIVCGMVHIKDPLLLI